MGLSANSTPDKTVLKTGQILITVKTAIRYLSKLEVRFYCFIFYLLDKLIMPVRICLSLS